MFYITLFRIADVLLEYYYFNLKKIYLFEGGKTGEENRFLPVASVARARSGQTKGRNLELYPTLPQGWQLSYFCFPPSMSAGSWMDRTVAGTHLVLFVTLAATQS